MKSQIIILLFLLSFNAFSQEVYGPENIEAYKNEVLALINQQRADLGAGPVERDLQIEEIMQAYNDRMAEGESGFGHHGFSNRCKQARLMVGGNLCGEILAWGHKSAEKVHLGWTNSPGHYKNMIEKRFTRAGIAFTRNDKGRPYWSVFFLEH